MLGTCDLAWSCCCNFLFYYQRSLKFYANSTKSALLLAHFGYACIFIYSNLSFICIFRIIQLFWIQIFLMNILIDHFLEFMGNFQSRIPQTHFIIQQSIFIILSSKNYTRMIKKTKSVIYRNQNNIQISPIRPLSTENRYPSSIHYVNGQKISISFNRQLQAKSVKMREEQHIGIRDVMMSSLRFFVCRLCYGNYQMKDTGSFGQCGHTFCYDCLTQYCIYKIKIKEEIYCPEEGCKMKLNPQSTLFDKLPEQMKQKYQENQLWKQVINNPNAKLCPSQKCVGGVVNLLIQPPQCQKCHQKFCKQCMMDFHEGPCDQNFQDYFREWKRCPQCKTFIEKTQGCNHMTCRCTHQFCFVCLSDWEQSHYSCIEQINNRMFLNQVQQLPKSEAILYLIATLLFFPVMLALGLVLLVIGAVGASLISILVGPFVTTQQIIKSCCSCLPCCLVLWIISIPIAIVIGVIGAPIFFITSTFKPFAQRHLRRYWLTINFLVQQIRGRQQRRRVRPPIAPIQIPQ